MSVLTLRGGSERDNHEPMLHVTPAVFSLIKFMES